MQDLQSSKKRIGLYGGTFNPVHNGHLIQARDARERLKLDEVWLMPNARSPLRLGEELASGEERLKMLELAIGGEEGLQICDLEVRREGVSYTVDSLETLVSQYPEVEWSFLIGADSLRSFDRWVRVHEIVNLARVVVMNRPGADLERERRFMAERDADLADRVHLLHASRYLDLAANEVRNRLAEGKSVRFLVPDALADYLEQHGLYRSATS